MINKNTEKDKKILFTMFLRLLNNNIHVYRCNSAAQC